MTEHDGELRQYYAVRRKLDNALPDKKLAPKAWQAELGRLCQEYAQLHEELTPIYAELKKLRDIQHKTDGVLRRQKEPEVQAQKRAQDER